MELYTKTCTAVRTDDVISVRCEVNVGLQKGSLLSPLLFAVLLDVVFSERTSGVPSEFLYADATNNETAW